MESVTGIVLAGGQGRRMGGVDKGLQPLNGRALVERVIERLAPQVQEILVNANQNAGIYARFGHAVIADAVGGYAGPLAGLHAGLRAARHPLVVTVPCDSPFLPDDLVARLARALDDRGADVAVAKTFDRLQPVFALVRRSVLPQLERYLAGGDRKVDLWLATLKVAEVAFDDEAEAFSNINTRDELAGFEADAG